MAYTEIQEKKGKKYYYRVRSIRKGKKVSKEREYLGIDLNKSELSLEEKKADKILSNLKLLDISQELELLSSLEAHGAVPLKFSYIGEGAKKWVKIAQMSRELDGVEKTEDEILLKNLPSLFNETKDHDFQEIHIVDLGCGDGRPIEKVFKYLKENSFFKKYKITYIPIDISQKMLDYATEHISKTFDIKVKPILIDFEKGSFPEVLIKGQDKKSYNYCFFLGNTLGNFSDTGRILSNFKDSLFSTDYLIIGNELSNLQAVNKIIEYYTDPSVYELVITALKEYGYKDSDGKYHIRWNSNKRQIEGYIVLNRDIEFNIANSKIKFEKNEEILLFISKKFAEEELIELFNKIGFRIHLFTTNKEKRYCILSINPSRFRTN